MEGNGNVSYIPGKSCPVTLKKHGEILFNFKKDFIPGQLLFGADIGIETNGYLARYRYRLLGERWFYRV